MLDARRRQLITLLGGAAAWPLAARAQQSTMPVIGFLNSGLPDGYAPMVAAFRQGLSETGFVEGRNVAIEFRWAEGQNHRLPALAAAIPIVFEAGSDPVKDGLVASLNRPGGNVTGVSNFAATLATKVFELLHELVPNSAVIAVLVNPTSPNLAEPISKDMQAAGRALGQQIHVLNASTEGEIDAAFATLAQLRGAVVTSPAASL